MATARETMNTINLELKRVDGELDRANSVVAGLQMERDILAKLLAKLNGEPVQILAKRKRSPNVSPLVLDIMRTAGTAGATSSEVDALVKEQIPGVAKATVSSILSRLKAEGALIYVGERYYEKQYAPPANPSPFDGPLRAVN